MFQLVSKSRQKWDERIIWQILQLILTFVILKLIKLINQLELDSE